MYDKYVFTYIPYVDINIWVMILLISLAFLVISYVSPRARLMFAGLSLLFGVAVMWGSMGLARLGNAMYETVSTCNATVANLSTTEQTITYIPTVEILANEWLTTLCRAYVIVLFISFIWIGIESYLPKERMAYLGGGGVDMNNLDMAHDDKLHNVGGKR
jgi:hypothetical protein